jgi:hypothetical protein
LPANINSKVNPLGKRDSRRRVEEAIPLGDSRLGSQARIRRFLGMVGVFQGVLMATQSHPQAAGLGGLFKVLLLLRLLGHHPAIALVIAFSIIVAAVCVSVAGKRGRHTVGWAFLGFFFSIVAVIVLLVLPPLKPAKSESIGPPG